MTAHKRRGAHLNSGTIKRKHYLGTTVDQLRKPYDPGRVAAEDASREREVAEQVQAIRAEAQRRRDEAS